MIEITIPFEHGGKRLDVSLAMLWPEHSRSRIANWIKAGELLVDGDEASTKDKVYGGELIELHASTEIRTHDVAQAMPLDIVFEDAHIIVLNKAAGLVVHPGAGNRDGTLLNGLLHHAPEVAEVPRAGIVHRLDKDTSGLMVVAKTLLAQTSLVRQLQARAVSRHYVALVNGDFVRAQTIDAPIGRHRTQRTKMAVTDIGGKDAVTHAEPMQAFDAHTLVLCKLETGRTHQIRVHLAHIGFPIVGDAVYGRKPSKPAFARQALHATRLALVHPESDEEMDWEVPLPEDMQRLVESLA